MEETRYADTGKTLWHLATHFVVHCPKCEGKAHVHHDKKLTCSACFHVEKPGNWYGAMTAYVSVKCRDCYAPIHRSAPSDGKWKKLSTQCDQCGAVCEYEASLTKHNMNNGLMCDSVYGLPLWLQKEYKDELLWAYNYEHLEILRQYIGAKLRERGVRVSERGLNPRGSIRNNSAMLSRLPQFIKRAANRDGLLKVIEQLSLK